MPHRYLMKEFEEFTRTSPTVDTLMQHIAQRIHLHIPRYNWAGFYLVSKEDSSTLVLGPYAGSFTPTPKITLGQGLCGAAASAGRLIVADNVSEDPRYLQASDLVKSQISAPVNIGRHTIAIFNVESYFMAAFKAPQEREFVENCAKLVAKCFEKSAMRDLAHV
jgi:L-methionine (R)-S-oxide reductase